MIRLIGLMVKFPSNVFLFGLEALMKSVRSFQQSFERGVDTITEEMERNLRGADHETAPASPARHFDQQQTAQGVADVAAREPQPCPPAQQEARNMRDKDLSGDDLKLVKFKILFVRRDFEAVLFEDEELVSEQLDEAGFAAWKTAEFIQAIESTVDPLKVRVPSAWREGGKVKPHFSKYVKDNRVIGLPHEDKKFLRVYFEVEERYPREEAVYDRDQARAVEGIRDLLSKWKSERRPDDNNGDELEDDEV